MSVKYYVSTSIPYVNSLPHVGFALELVLADAIARYQRLLGKDVFFLTGTDEHGIKIAQTAEKEGLSCQELCDKYSFRFQELTKKINSSNNSFIRTTDKKHILEVENIWKKIKGKGDLEKRKYQGLYCVGCEKFMLQKDLVNGKCPDHNIDPVSVEEENYFFKLSKYIKQIYRLIDDDVVLIFPLRKKREVLNMLENGIDDISFSRSKSAYKWGIPVPGDDDQLMYVWCDALSNYYSGLDDKNYWPADLHVLGKDIIKFHAVYWLGMLLSLDLPLPKAIMCHGFITSEGQKMSKSLGNVKNPFDYIENFGEDALRFFLLKEIPTLDDGDFGQARFEVVYQDDLVNNIGNLVSRVMSMNEKYFDGVLPEAEIDPVFLSFCNDIIEKYHQSFLAFDLKKALESVLSLATFANRSIEEKKPWQLAKSDNEALKKVIFNLCETIRIIGILLLPFVPRSAERILKIFEDSFVIDDARFEFYCDFGRGQGCKKLNKNTLFFPRK